MSATGEADCSFCHGTGVTFWGGQPCDHNQPLVTARGRWTVKTNNIGTPNEVHDDQGHRIRVQGPLAVPIASHVAHLLNGIDDPVIEESA